jgi:zinc finger FYVE domain-containing protein 1
MNAYEHFIHTFSIRCSQTMNHQDDEEDHHADKHCKYQAQFDNRIYLCKECHHNGIERVVVPKTCSSKEGSFLGLAMYAWAG